MGEFSKWLLHDDQKEIFEFLFAAVWNIAFLALSALLLWPFGKASMALHFAKGFWVFWLSICLTGQVLQLFCRIFRVDMYSHFDVFVISAMIVSGFLQLGWSAFAALTVLRFVGDAPYWIAAVLFLVGFISCHVAFTAVSAFYGGHLYRFVNMVLALAGFLVFAVWPAGGSALYGWFFNSFEGNG